MNNEDSRIKTIKDLILDLICPTYSGFNPRGYYLFRAGAVADPSLWGLADGALERYSDPKSVQALHKDTIHFAWLLSKARGYKEYKNDKAFHFFESLAFKDILPVLERNINPLIAIEKIFSFASRNLHSEICTYCCELEGLDVKGEGETGIEAKEDFLEKAQAFLLDCISSNNMLLIDNLEKQVDQIEGKA